MFDKIFIWLLFFGVGAISGSMIHEYSLNKDAQHHAGECFRAKGEIPLKVEILGISDGKYQLAFEIFLMRQEGEELISKTDASLSSDFVPIECDPRSKK